MGSVAVIEPHEGTPDDSVHVYPPQKANVSPATESSGSQPIDGHNVKTNGISHVVENSEGPSSHVVEPVAIIGMAMRLPGGVNNAESFWDLLVNKRDGRCQVPSNRYNVDAWYDPDKPGHVGTKYGYFLEDLNLANMDVGFWSMSKQEVESMDPQQRLLLEVVFECLESSGTTSWQSKNIGCYVGTFGEDWLNLDGEDQQNSNMYRFTGYSDFVTANRVSYEFDLKGPSITIRTGCSSSIIGLHEACQALYNGDCNSAIVGGTNLIMTPRMTIAATDQGVISPTGSCKSFDADADGYARGEAVSAIYVKKLSDAIRDGDPVRAVIRSTCTNHDGRTVGLTHPSTEAHESLIRRGHQLAGIRDLSQTAMVECHGTGTKIGDPIEVKAVANVFGEYGIYIGSVKSNLGHSEGASGLSSVIKMVLALEHKTIPPNVNFNRPNPAIPWHEAKLKVPVDPAPWPSDRAERVGINSFAIGGINSHVLLESAASHGLDGTASTNEPPDDDHPSLLVFSAKHPESLRRTVENHASYLACNPKSVIGVAHTLGANRELLSHRGFCVVKRGESLSLSSTMRPEGTPSVIFTFTGQGSQWPEMGKELFIRQESFAESIAKLDNVLSSLPEPPSWTLQNEILKPESESRLSKAEFSQPCCTAIQVALVDLLHKWGIKPAAVVGHSSGEIGAAYAAGAITAKEAILIAFFRGQASLGLGKVHRGGMAAIGLGRKDVTTYLRKGVTIGCENSPKSVTLTGDQDTLEEIMNSIRKEQPHVLVRALRVECAYHSHHMKSVEATYQAMLGQTIHARQPVIPFFSSVTGQILSDDRDLSTKYWLENSTSPVLFLSAVNAAIDYSSSPITFLEIGPHSALAGPIRQIIGQSQRDAHYVSTLVRNEDSSRSLLKAAGELWISDATIDLRQVNPTGPMLTNLPTYPWNHDGEYWAESRLSKDSRQRKFAHHDILGARVVASSDLNPLWRNIVHLDRLPWIRDHEIAHKVLFPAAGYVAMAGEAVRQLDSTNDYTVREVNFIAALVITDGKPVELQTHLRKAKLTSSLDSEWYEFSVASLKEGSWITHCTGQVRKGQTSKVSGPVIPVLPRKVPSSIWYRAIANIGLNYGPRFRGLQNISADIPDLRAVATVTDSSSDGETPYQLHPSTIDNAFQLLPCAVYRGLGCLFTKLSVPTYLEEMYVGPTKGAITMQADGKSSNRGTITGNLVGVSAGDVVIKVKGLRMSPLGDNDESLTDDPHAAAELEWKSDVNFIDANKLMWPAEENVSLHGLIERLALACMIETHIQVSDIHTDQPHLNKFRDWLGTRQALAKENNYPNVPDSGAIVAMDRSLRKALIERVYAESLQTDAAAPATAIHLLYKHAASIFEGATQPLDLLMKEDILTQVYDFMQLCDYGQYFELLGHRKPDMRILEIGAGTGGTSSRILSHLKSNYGERMYGSYKYTDVSAGFFVQAAERFKKHRGLDFAVLDISHDPIAQSFESESFDLVIATNVLHATASLKDTLSNVRKLLHPRGRLFLQGLDPSTKWINYIMGILPGWWLGEQDGRPTEPYVSAARWDKELKSAGFEGVDSVLHDGYLLNNIIAKPAQGVKTRRVTVLLPENAAQHTDAFLQYLTKRHYELEVCTIHQAPKAKQDILALLDLESPFLYKATEDDFAAFKVFLPRIQESGVLWVTQASQINCKDPNYSLVLGLVRTIRREFGLEIATCELDTLDSIESREAVADLLGDFKLRDPGSKDNSGLEYVFSDGRLQVGRFHWTKVSKQLKSVSHEAQSRTLRIGRPGILQTLYWVEEELVELKGNWVEVDTRAVGLNFKDIMISMGIVDDEGQGLGCDLSGIVRKLGPDVKHLKEGDRVLCFSNGTFRTTFSANELLFTKLPNTLGFLEAATMPCVYITVIYGLMDIARLAKSQTILIHSAAGGVGIAAIQIARMVGAEIFCTVGNPDKMDFVMRTFGISRNRIFNSRDTSFLNDVLRETDGKGVDVVLSSLSGELLHTSWKCVAKFGTMVEIGKRDLIGHGRLSMNLFEQNRKFAGVDISQLCTNRPQVIHDLLCRTVQFYESGYIKPIAPIKEFEAIYVEEAMRYMQKGQHMGKIVITMPENPLELQARAGARTLALRPEVSYLFIGGLGGLGRSIASWLVECGARNMIFFSRSAGKVTQDDSFLKELEAQGCFVQKISGSVTNLEDVKKVVSFAAKPIAGVLQASMVLKDASFTDMSFEQWQAALLPKVQGTWNVHNILLEQKHAVDFFFLFSSLSGIGGQPGQANYAAGNTFLDAFVQYRHSLGLPASVLDIGAIEDIGYLSNSDNRSILESLKATSAHTLHEQDLLDSIQLMINRSTPHGWPSNISATSSSPFTQAYVNQSQVAIGVRSTIPLSFPNNRIMWKNDPRMAVYRNLESIGADSSGDAKSEDLTQFLRDCRTNPILLDSPESIALIAKEAGVILFGFLMRSEEDLDLNVPLSVLGVDSLVSIELRNWFRQKVGVELTVLEVVFGSLMAVGEQAAGRLKEKLLARN